MHAQVVQHKKDLLLGPENEPRHEVEQNVGIERAIENLPTHLALSKPCRRPVSCRETGRCGHDQFAYRRQRDRLCRGAVRGDTLLRSFALWPPGAAGIGADGGFSPWQLVTYAFLHASVPHLVFNMFGMFMFGRDVERALGRARTGALYLASVLSAAFTQMAVVGLFTFPAGPIVGASGGVFGLLLAYAVLFPRRMILLLIPPIPMPAWLFATVYALVELTLGVSGSHSGVAHFAHLGGMAGSGVLLWRWFRGRDDAR